MSPSIPLMKLTRWQWLQCHLTCSSQGQVDSVPFVEIVENTLSKVRITQDTSTSHLNRNCTKTPTRHWPRTMQVTWHILLWWDCLGSIRLMLSSDKYSSSILAHVWSTQWLLSPWILCCVISRHIGSSPTLCLGQMRQLFLDNCS